MSNLKVPLKSDLYEILEGYTDFEFYNYEAELHGGLLRRFHEHIDFIKACVRSTELLDDELMIEALAFMLCDLLFQYNRQCIGIAAFNVKQAHYKSIEEFKNLIELAEKSFFNVEQVNFIVKSEESEFDIKSEDLYNSPELYLNQKSEKNKSFNIKGRALVDLIIRGITTQKEKFEEMELSINQPVFNVDDVIRHPKSEFFRNSIGPFIQFLKDKFPYQNSRDFNIKCGYLLYSVDLIESKGDSVQKIETHFDNTIRNIIKGLNSDSESS
jgi:hypothetical protein